MDEYDSEFNVPNNSVQILQQNDAKNAENEDAENAKKSTRETPFDELSTSSKRAKSSKD